MPEENKLQFVASDWVLAIKRWSATWTCPKTGEVGSTIYFPEDGRSTAIESSDGKGQLVAIKGDRNAPADPNHVTLMYRLYNGRTAYEQSPDNAYLNINPEYNGARLMTIGDYKAECKTRKIPIEMVSTALDSYLTSRA